MADPQTGTGGYPQIDSAKKLNKLDVLSGLKDESKNSLTSLLQDLDEKVEKEFKKDEGSVDVRRCQIINRLYELLSEHCNPSVGVLQSNLKDMFAKTNFHNAQVFFYTSDEIDDGCRNGPSVPLITAMDYGLDDRLYVTLEIFESMLFDIQNLELAQILDAYTDYAHVMETAWQVNTVESKCSSRDVAEIRNSAGLAVLGEFAYVADSYWHVIFRVNMKTDEITAWCGMRGKPGFHDGPREMAMFNTPCGLAICRKTSTLYVADTKNDAIRTIGIPSGVVQTLPLTSVDPNVQLVAPVGLTMVFGEYEYEEPSDEENEATEGLGLTFQDSEEEEDEDLGGGSRHVPLLEGITEEDEEEPLFGKYDSRRGSGLTSRRESGGMNLDWWGDAMARKQLDEMRRRSARYSLADEAISGKSSVRTSRRTSRAVTSSANTTRRTSFTLPTPGESAIESLKECTEEEEFGFNLGVTCDHCVFLVLPSKGELVLIAGSVNEYGYKDASKGSEARFSSLKGITCIRNSIFVADHWNNVIRCINLKTTQVDTVVDFEPNGPIALAVSGSGNLFVLDSEFVHCCNILKICSLHASKQTEGALGTLSFRALQKQIGEARSGLSSAASSRRSSMEGYPSGRRRSSGRRASGDDSRPQSRDGRRSIEGGVAPPSGNRPAGQPGRGSISDLRENATGHKKDGGPQRIEPPPGFRPLPGHPMGQPGQFLAIPGSQSPVPPLQDKAGHSPRGSVSSPRPDAQIPELPSALRSLVPGASLHPALFHMAVRSRRNSQATQVTGSQFRVSVASSAEEDIDGDQPKWLSHLVPKESSPWKTVPICSLQYIYHETSRQCYPNTPLSLAYWDTSEEESTADLVDSWHSQALLVGLIEWPSLVKVHPPSKPIPEEVGRFRAISVDIHRCIMADAESNQIFVINHTKHTKDKIAGCGKGGYLDGPLDVCRLNRPSSITLDPTTHFIYVADQGNHRIRCIDLSTGFMSTVCGNGTKGTQDSADIRTQSLDSPFNLHFVPPHHLLISCADNSVRRFDLQTSMLETVLIGS
eukprot:gnl/MRDRNA2_/MRDRNA2_116099_c0_seq1.p1 gnl/MRDRNA2_/MRDRNA2_116099_c0~~gnl/MRDRNA2_/MRDRNA2_116099_c0_seq1.p1  ORF type:complete len:1069 (-),score=150.90 gnl/MRDRNA2_/MRDRNA2_116099_c0_seq1:47-3175(-)